MLLFIIVIIVISHSIQTFHFFTQTTHTKTHTQTITTSIRCMENKFFFNRQKCGHRLRMCFMWYYGVCIKKNTQKKKIVPLLCTQNTQNTTAVEPKTKKTHIETIICDAAIKKPCFNTKMGAQQWCLLLFLLFCVCFFLLVCVFSGVSTLYLRHMTQIGCHIKKN